MKKSKRKEPYKLRLSPELVEMLKTSYSEKIKSSAKLYKRNKKHRKRISFEEA